MVGKVYTPNANQERFFYMALCQYSEPARISNKKGRQLGFKWRGWILFLVSEVKSHKTQVLFGVPA